MTNEIINNKFKQEVPTTVRNKIILENFDEIYQNKELIKDTFKRIDYLLSDDSMNEPDEDIFKDIVKIFKS